MELIERKGDLMQKENRYSVLAELSLDSTVWTPPLGYGEVDAATVKDVFRSFKIASV
jgi:hypothetical protein